MIQNTCQNLTFHIDKNVGRKYSQIQTNIEITIRTAGIFLQS
nr:MAG TPA: hypothetical protein [Caudoviricetes sp.]